MTSSVFRIIMPSVPYRVVGAVKVFFCVLVSMGLSVGTYAHAGTSKNGTSKNGTSKNGTSKNGTSKNGTSKNGTSKNGTSKNGTSKNGTSKNGFGGWLEGMRFIGHRAEVNRRAEVSYRDTLIIESFRGNRVIVRQWTKVNGWYTVNLHARELLGVRWSELVCESSGKCQHVEYRIADTAGDSSSNTMTQHADNRDIWLYQLEYRVLVEESRGANQADWTNPCGAGNRGLFVDGRWSDDGSHDPRGYTFSCTSGAIAKCAQRWGYKPWKVSRAAGGVQISLSELHQACVRAVRADYCGDGTSFTRDGTVIDVFDEYGFNARDTDTGFSREAGFSTRGAVWFARPRLPNAARDVDGSSAAVGVCVDDGHSAGNADRRALITVWSER